MYIIVPNEGEIIPAKALLNVAKNNVSDPILKTYNNLSMTLENLPQLHWITQLNVSKKIDLYNLKFKSEKISYGKRTNLKYVQLIAFVDRVFPWFIGHYAQGG